MKKSFAFSLALLALWCACNSTDPIQTAVEQYQVSAKKTGIPTQGATDTLMRAYQAFVDKSPDNPQTPEYLYEMSKLYQVQQKFDQQVATCQTILDKYPTFNKNAEVQFLQAFAYENYLHDTAKAKAAYDAFLQKYPTHQLAGDAKVAVENLGKSPEELLKMLIEKHKNSDLSSKDSSK